MYIVSYSLPWGGGIFSSHLGSFSREREKREGKRKNGGKKGGKEGEGEGKRGKD